MEAPSPSPGLCSLLRRPLHSASRLFVAFGHMSSPFQDSQPLCFLLHPLLLPLGLGSKNFHCTLVPVSFIFPSSLASPQWKFPFMNKNKKINSSASSPIQWCAGAHSHWPTRADCSNSRNFAGQLTVMLVTWNQPQWKHVHYEHQQMLSIRAFLGVCL